MPLLGVVVTIGTDPRARGAEPTPTVSESAPAKKKAEPSPLRGSEIAYRNSASAISLDRSAELTYNPTWVMALELSPRFWFSDVVSVGASIDFQRELTNADDTTERGETLVGDLSLRVAASRWAVLPGDIEVSSALGFTFPTSLASQGDSMVMTVSPSLSLSKTFGEVLSGLTIGYGLRFTKLFHSYTTASLDSPVIATCFAGSDLSCDRFLNAGVRNVSFRVSNGLSLGLDFTDWLSFSADFAVVVSWLYDASTDERVSLETIEGQDARYALVADLGVSARPWSPFEIRLGASTINPELAPDGSSYAPFFNRYTAIYLDLRLDVARAVAELVSQED